MSITKTYDTLPSSTQYDLLNSFVHSVDALMMVRAQAFWAFSYFSAELERDFSPHLTKVPSKRLATARAAQDLIDDLDHVWSPTI